MVQDLTYRVRVLQGAILCVIVVIFARLLYLQVACADYFLKKSEQNFLRFEPVQPVRGNIRDRNGNLLATNRPVINLYWYGMGSRSLSGEHCVLLQHIEEILKVPLYSDPVWLGQIAAAERMHRTHCLAKDLSFEQLSKIQERFAHVRSLLVEQKYERLYPCKQIASHVLGYLSNPAHAESVGQMGLEKILENTLRGAPGAIAKQRNSKGKQLHQEMVHPMQPGVDIVTTLDLTLQQIAERSFPAGYAGALVVLHPGTGDILCAVSRPTFDPTAFLSRMSSEQWSLLQEDRPFLNRVFSATYPPGSIFKLITIAASMESGLIDESMLWDCKGHVRFGGRTYWCHKRNGHGIISTKDAVAHSCNVLFYEIGKRLDIDFLADYAQRFGLGAPMHTLFPEASGLIPSRAWKQETKGEPWWTGETLSVAIGQSYLLCTPLQVARMVGGIFTGQLVHPRIIQEEPIERLDMPISESTRAFLKKLMRAVVKRGTGKRVRTIEDIAIYAKTSTAQTSSFNKRKLGKEYQEHGWLVVYFEYKDYDPLVLVALIEHAGSSQLAAQATRAFLIEYKKYKDRAS